MKICKVEGCNRKHEARGYCQKHYARLMRKGSAENRTTRDPNEYWFKDDVCYVQIYDKRSNPTCVFMIDKEDYERIKSYKWTANMATGTISSTKIKNLSRFITNTTNPDIEVDHKNHNRFDNRKENLRPCTRSQNQMNRIKEPRNSSGVKGVSWNKWNKKWWARIHHKKKEIHLGYFTTIQEATIVRKQAERKYYGEFALIEE